jgi:putative ABC transport system permease protein
MIRSFARLQAVYPGFNADRLLTMNVLLTGPGYSQDQSVITFFREAVERIGHLPGVRAAGAINFLPLTGMASATSFTIVGRPDPGAGNKPGTEVRVIDPNYFRAMGIPLLLGRAFTAGDTQKSPRVLIVSETLAHRFFPGENPLGKKLIIDWNDNLPDEIVGVVGDILHYGMDAQPEPIVYWPEARMPYSAMTIVARTAGDSMSVASAAIKEIHEMHPDQPVSDVRSMNAVIGESVSRQRFNMLLLAVFAGVAMLLAVVGIYGVMAYGVTQRRHEIGIRVALGARRGDVVRMVMGQGLALTMAGIGIGAGAAYALTRLMKTLLFGVTATDPATFAGVALLLATVATVACYFPARRATRVDPVVALRYE